MEGSVYVLTNPAMPGYVKIGKTDNLEERLKSLDRTSTPLPFQCEYAAEVNDADKVEKILHDIFETEEDKLAVEKTNTKRSRFNFEMVKINPGAELYFTKDENVKCVVKDKYLVEFENSSQSLTEVTKKLISSLGYNWKQVRGPAYWLYEDETLVERRLRMETND